MLDADLWPPFGLRIRCGDLELRVPGDDDMAALIGLAAEGIHDPQDMPFSIPWTDLHGAAFERGFLQYHWSCRASLAPERWSLPLMVRCAGEVVGTQDLEATDFSVLGEVVTGSWLSRRFQRRGIGRRMREAVLAFAFDHLHARRARSSAFADNPASIAVSRALGYRDNGSALMVRRGAAVEQLRFLMDRRDWAARDRTGVEVEGLEACREMLGAGLSDR